MIAPVQKVEADEGSQLPCQLPATVGMTLAVNANVRFNANRREASRVSQAGPFTGFDAAESQSLVDWLATAKARGIDAVIDLAPRPWNVAGVQAIAGVFKRNLPLASWLIVRCDAGWLLTRPDGSVSDVSPVLSDILAQIGNDRRR
jgi:hypothetical protein